MRHPRILFKLGVLSQSRSQLAHLFEPSADCLNDHAPARGVPCDGAAKLATGGGDAGAGLRIDDFALHQFIHRC